MHTYISIDLKSFYASVECADRSLNPLTTNLVVADTTRTEKTICLAVSPSLKALGIPGRPRLFEVVQKVREINSARLARAVQEHRCVRTHDGKDAFFAASFDAKALEDDPSLELSYITAPPRMARYEEISASIYAIYLKYIAPEDIHVYSIDEVFMDVTQYLTAYRMDAHTLAMTIIREVLYVTGITATAGIGTNLYLAKVAMDIVAKHVPPDKDGVRIAFLDEMRYRRLLWGHVPLADFWRVGGGTQRRLHTVGIYTMGDIARCSVGKSSDYHNEDLLFRLFGVNAELLIDHAWGWEPCTIEDIRAYHPDERSLCSGQVLPKPYSFEKGRLIVKEMTDSLVLDLVRKDVLVKQLTLTIGYDAESLLQPGVYYGGPVGINHYGKAVPHHAHATAHLEEYTGSGENILQQVLALYDRIVSRDLLIRRVTICACNIRKREELDENGCGRQMNLFTDYGAGALLEREKQKRRKKERNLQHAVLQVQGRYGKNLLLKGMNLEEDAMETKRNQMIGGHKA